MPRLDANLGEECALPQTFIPKVWLLLQQPPPSYQIVQPFFFLLLHLLHPLLSLCAFSIPIPKHTPTHLRFHPLSLSSHQYPHHTFRSCIDSTPVGRRPNTDQRRHRVKAQSFQRKCLWGRGIEKINQRQSIVAEEKFPQSNNPLADGDMSP